MSSQWREGSVKGYLDALASAEPTPGGGSVAALAAACGVGLLAMAGRISKVPPTTVRQLDRLRQRATAMIDRDGEAYAQFMRELRAFRAKPDKLQLRRLQKALEEAIFVPLEVREVCEEASKMAPVIERSSRRWLASDVAIAKGLLVAAKRSTAVLVRANLAVVRQPALRQLVRQVRGVAVGGKRGTR